VTERRRKKERGAFEKKKKELLLYYLLFLPSPELTVCGVTELVLELTRTNMFLLSFSL